MSAHTLKIQSRWLERVVSGEKRAEIREHDRDFQVGDRIDLVEVNERGYPVRDWVERDERGRFVYGWVDRPTVPVVITHVLLGRFVDGVDDAYCVLSIELVEAGEG